MTAKDLLYQYLDYWFVKQQVDHFNYDAIKIREMQIGILLDQFGLTKKHIQITEEHQSEYYNRILNQHSEIEHMSMGSFLEFRADEENKEISNKIATALKQVYSNLPEDKLKNPGIHWLFQNLLGFRKEVYQFTQPEAGQFEGFDPGLQYSFLLRGKLKHKVKNDVEEIDEVLCLILDPRKRVLDKAELIAKFNYPDADLHKLDMEWWMKKFDNY
jgi:hypothetical protein